MKVRAFWDQGFALVVQKFFIWKLQVSISNLWDDFGVSHDTMVTISWHQRELICEEIGAWITRCVSGLHRGSSGRDKNPLASRLWVVVRDFEGIIYDPPIVFRAFSGARLLCKRGQDAGDSIFVGVPSEREAERVIRSSGLHWSGTFQP